MPPKSDFWKYFDKCVEDKNYAKCQLCSKKIKTCGNTSNLKCHLKSIHKEFADKIDKSNISIKQVICDSQESVNLMAVDNDDTRSISSLSEVSESSSVSVQQPSISGYYTSTPYKRQKTLVETVKTLESYSECGSKYLKITNSILYMICRDYQPISIVENEGFQNLIKQLSGGLYKIPSRKTINALLDKKYTAVSNLFRQKIQTLSSYTITTDIWTETMQSKSYIGLTLHFVDYFKIDSVTLGVTELCQPHTGKYLQEVLTAIMEDWHIITEHVSAIITDGAANIGNAVESIFGKKIHLHCFAHQINLIAERAVGSCEPLTELLKKMKQIITWFKQSVNASDELRKAQDSDNVKKLIQEVSTRWNSTYYSISRFLELRDIINQIVNRHPSAPAMINAREAEDLKEVQEILLPLEAATKQLSGEKYTTSSIVIPMIFNIKKKTEGSTPQYDIGKKLKESLLLECNKRFGMAEQVYLLSISTLLDPRFKKIYFTSPINCAKAVQTLQEEMQLNMDVCQQSSSTVSEPDEQGKNYFFWHNLLHDIELKLF